LRRLGDRLGYAGKYDDALTATESAVRAARGLAREPVTSDQNLVLAVSLGDLAERLSHVDRREEALVAAQESTHLLREIVTTGGGDHLAELASATNALAVTLGAVGRDAEAALSATREVVRIRRLLVARDPAHTAALTMALNNLSVDLSAADQMAPALAAGEESTALFEALYAQNPTPHRPDLAMALNNLGIRLLNVGRPQDALEPLTRSVELHRRLARDNPAFGPDLAWGLSTLAWALGTAGGTDPHRAAAAADTAQDALDLFELESGPLPTTFTDGRFEAIEALLGELDAPATRRSPAGSDPVCRAPAMHRRTAAPLRTPEGTVALSDARRS
jgi:tetratricopeptide (TPR) repeat protein